jgi:hypothetical protein
MPSFRILVVLVAAVLSASCARVLVVKLDPNQSIPAQGVIYALPNTVVRMQIKLDRTELNDAMHARYAALFAPEGEPVCKDKDCMGVDKATFSLQSGAVFATYGEPDPQNIYLVKFTKRSIEDQSISMTWNEAGLLSSAGSSVTNRSVDVAMSGVKLLATLATKGGFGSPLTSPDGKTKCSERADADGTFLPKFDKLGGPAGRLLIRNYCNMTPADRNALPSGDDFGSALDAYVEQVAPLVTARWDILRGQADALDSAQLLPKIEAEITNQLTELYLGKKSVKTWEGTLDLRGIASEGEFEVLRIVPEHGFCTLGAQVAPDSKPLPDKMTQLDEKECMGGELIKLKIAYHPDRSSQLFSKLTDVTDDERSFRYRVPAQVTAVLGGNNKKSYGAALLWVGQLGTVISLPAERRSKTLSYDLAFVEATGALKSFKLGSTGALETSAIDALSAVGGTVLDAEKARKDAADELAVLNREAALLKARDEICTIQQKYGVTCTDMPK